MNHYSSIVEPTENGFTERKQLSERYLRVTSFAGLGIFLLGFIVLQLLPSASSYLIVLLTILIPSCLNLILVHFKQIAVATQIHILGAFVQIILLSQQSYDASLIATASLLTLILAIMMLLQRWLWRLYLTLTLFFMVWRNWQHFDQLVNTEYEQFTINIILQFMVFFTGAAVVSIAYYSLRNHHGQLKKTVLALKHNQALLEERSAELETANQALRRNENRYRTLVETASEAIFLCELPTWRILDTNQAAVHLLKYSREELLASRAIDFVEGPNLRLGKIIDSSTFHDTVTRGDLLEFEQTHINKYGKRFLAHVRMLKLPDEDRVRVTVIDITDKRAAEAAAHKTAEQLRLISDNLSVMFAYYDNALTLQFWNKPMQNILGLHDIAPPMAADHVFEPEMFTVLEPHLQMVMAGERSITELVINSADGRSITGTATFVPHIVEGEIVGIFSSLIDVTAEREAQQALAKAQEALQRTQKVESLGILAGGIAHDFNNLLVAILGQSSIAAAKLEPLHPAKRHIDRAIQAGERASLLTNQMLAYSGHGAFLIAPLNLNALIEENLELFRVSIPSTITFSTEYCRDLPLIDADAAQIQQVIMNLIINASQAMNGQAGSICVKTNSVQLSADAIDALALAEGNLEPGQHSVVSVLDNGKGMDAETLSRIFDPFFTTKDTGSGLGLAAVLGIVKGHHGGIAVQSQVGVGTAFHFYFPVSQQVVEEAVISAEFAPSSDHAGHTVLVIDDDPSVTNAIADILELENINTVEINDPCAGIDYYRDNRHTIDIVMLDLMMPKMNGAEVFDALYAIDPTVCVLLSSGYSKQDITRRFMINGIADFIQKPYNFQQLIERINGLVDKQ